MKALDKIITCSEAAQILGVSRQWMAELVRQGELNARKADPRGPWLFVRSEIERMSKRRQAK